MDLSFFHATILPTYRTQPQHWTTSPESAECTGRPHSPLALCCVLAFCDCAPPTVRPPLTSTHSQLVPHDSLARLMPPARSHLRSTLRAALHQLASCTPPLRPPRASTCEVGYDPIVAVEATRAGWRMHRAPLKDAPFCPPLQDGTDGLLLLLRPCLRLRGSAARRLMSPHGRRLAEGVAGASLRQGWRQSRSS